MTKKLISDAVLFRLAGGIPDNSFPIDERDVWAALGQKINAKFKVEFFTETLPNGETLPNNSCLAYYENIAVTSNADGTSKCTLPAMPVPLIRNIGVFQVTDSKDQLTFIPLMPSQKHLLKNQPLVNDLLGQVGYEIFGRTVKFTKDITLLGATTVNMVLVVLAISEYSQTDTLPIPASMVEELVLELVAQFAPVQPESAAVNNYTTNGQNNPIPTK